MRVYINDRISEDYGMGVVIVAAENKEEAQWLVREHENHKGEPLFNKEGWKEFDGVYPEYVITKGKVLYYCSYIE